MLMITNKANLHMGASSAGEIVCREYEKPKEMDAQSKSRAKNATKIYNMLTQ